jgi:hypothetical protein
MFLEPLEPGRLEPGHSSIGIDYAASTNAAANGLDTNTELCGNGSQANSTDSADSRTPRGMDCRPTNRLAALSALGLGPRHAGQHALADDRPLELAEH